MEGGWNEGREWRDRGRRDGERREGGWREWREEGMGEEGWGGIGGSGSGGKREVGVRGGRALQGAERSPCDLGIHCGSCLIPCGARCPCVPGDDVTLDCPPQRAPETNAVVIIDT